MEHYDEHRTSEKVLAVVSLSCAGLWAGVVAAVLLAVGMPGASVAGGGASSAEGGIALTVVSDLSVTNLAPMAFPTVVQGADGPLDDESPAEFRVDGEPWENVRVEVNALTHLDGPGGSVPVELRLSNGDTSVTASLQFSGSINFPVRGTIPSGGIPDAPGTYSGVFTVTVEYE